MFKVPKAQSSFLFITDNEYSHKYVHIFTVGICSVTSRIWIHLSCLVCLPDYSQPRKVLRNRNKYTWKEEHGV